MRFSAAARRTCLGLMFFAAALPAPAASLDEVMARLEAADKNIQTLHFKFTRLLKNQTTGDKKISHGTADFSRPRRFRIEVVSSEGREIVVSDGTSFFVWDVGASKFMQEKWEKWSYLGWFPRELAPFQMNVSQLRENYDIELEQPGDGAQAMPTLKLTPKKSPGWPYVLRLWIDMKQGLPAKMELAPKGLLWYTEVQDIQINPPLDGKIFEFTPPAGSRTLDTP